MSRPQHIVPQVGVGGNAEGSALSFDLRAIKTPAWLSAGNAKVRPESVAGLPLSIKPDAPAGTQSVELEFEIVNFHPAPDRNLRVRLSVEIERH